MAQNDFLPIEGEQPILEKEILDIIEVNSYSKNILAAYKGKIVANKISKEKYGKKNYKEYVEMLMITKFPNEHKKMQLSKKLLCLVIIIPIIYLLLWLFFGRIISLCLWPLISSLIIWKMILPTYENLKKMYL